MSQQPPDETQLHDPLAEPRWPRPEQQLTMPDPLAEPRRADVLAESGWRHADEPAPQEQHLPPQSQLMWSAEGEPLAPR